MSQEPTIKASIAEVYADALYDAAAAAGTTDDVLGDIASLVELARNMPELREFLCSPAISTDQKLQVLERAFGECLNLLTLATLRSMAHRDRLDLWTEFLHEMEVTHRKRRGRVLVDALTPMPLTPDQVRRIERALSEKYQVQIALNIISSPNLIGGVQLKIGDTFVDGSVRQKLFDMTRRIRHTVLIDEAVDSRRMVLD